MKMRDLINIVNESTSKVNLDALAKKFGGGYTWKDTHFKNILYNIEPMSTRIAAALALDGGEPGTATEQMFKDDFYENFKDFTPEMYDLLWTDEGELPEDADMSSFKESIQDGLCNLMVPWISDELGDFLFNDTGLEALGIIEIPGASILVGDNFMMATYSYHGDPTAVLNYLKKFRAKFDKECPQFLPHKK